MLTNLEASYIAILIGRLGLAPLEAQEEYMALWAEVLAGPIEEDELDEWIKKLVKKHTGDSETMMFDPQAPTNHCKTYVLVSHELYASNN